VKIKKRKFTAENAEDAEQDKEYGQDDRMDRIKHTAPGSSLLSSPSCHPVKLFSPLLCALRALCGELSPPYRELQHRTVRIN
jgi:hypothetical protein